MIFEYWPFIAETNKSAGQLWGLRHFVTVNLAGLAAHCPTACLGAYQTGPDVPVGAAWLTVN